MVNLTATELRERFETGASDAALDDIIAAERYTIESLFGADGSAVEVFDHKRISADIGYYERTYPLRLVTKRPISEITSITEQVGTMTTALAADDYVVFKGHQITRLYGGTNSRLRWGDLVTVTYVPDDDSPLRKQALIKLCQINLAENGYLLVKTPEFTLQGVENYQAMRAQVLRRLRRGPLL